MPLLTDLLTTWFFTQLRPSYKPSPLIAQVSWISSSIESLLSRLQAYSAALLPAWQHLFPFHACLPSISMKHYSGMTFCTHTHAHTHTHTHARARMQAYLHPHTRFDVWRKSQRQPCNGFWYRAPKCQKEYYVCSNILLYIVTLTLPEYALQVIALLSLVTRPVYVVLRQDVMVSVT